MTKKSWYSLLLQKILYPALLACLFLTLAAPVAGAALAEPPTVLYYLLEMQRRNGKGCAGEAVTLPSLTPDRVLEDIAEAASQPGQTLSAVLAQRGLEGKVFGARFSAPSPQAGVQYLTEKHCASIMNEGFTRIGGVKHNTQWVVLMAGSNAIPDPVLLAPDGSIEPLPQGYEPLPGGQPVAPDPSGATAPNALPGRFPPSEMEPAEPQATGVYADQRGQLPANSYGTARSMPSGNRPDEPLSQPLAPPPGMESVENRPSAPSTAEPYLPDSYAPSPYTPDSPAQGAAPPASDIPAIGIPPLLTPEQQGYITNPSAQTDAEDLEQARKRLGPDRSPSEALPAEPQVTGEFTYGPR